MDWPKKNKRWMTKDHIIDIVRRLKDRYENNSIPALQTINKTPVDDLTVQSAARQDILQAVSGTTLLDSCKEQFRALYISCNTGLQKDRYALLQIRFCEWISQCLTCGTPSKKAEYLNATSHDAECDQYNLHLTPGYAHWIWCNKIWKNNLSFFVECFMDEFHGR